MKYRFRMGKISRDLGKPFDQVTKDDLWVYIKRINVSPDFTDLTKLDYPYHGSGSHKPWRGCEVHLQPEGPLRDASPTDEERCWP